MNVPDRDLPQGLRETDLPGDELDNDQKFERDMARLDALREKQKERELFWAEQYVAGLDSLLQAITKQP